MTASTTSAPRSRYIDTLRAAAIVRVIVYNAFGWAWLTVALPAMGVMFALAGALMAGSLEKYGARRAVTSRMRRLLPALWALGAIAVPVMLWHGWSRTDPDHPRACFLPSGDPVPGSQLGPVLSLAEGPADYDVKPLTAAEAHAWLCSHPAQRPGADGGERAAPPMDC